MVDRLLPNSPTCLPATHLLPHKSGVEWGGAFCCTQPTFLPNSPPSPPPSSQTPPSPSHPPPSPPNPHPSSPHPPSPDRGCKEVEELLHSNNLFPLATEQTTHPPFLTLKSVLSLELN